MTGLFCFAGSALCMIAAAACFRANQRYRGAIDEGIGAGMKIPERVSPFYDATYLNTFMSVARSRPTAFGKSALELYVRPTLLWIDVSFAVFCAGFAALFWCGWLHLVPRYYELFEALIAMAVSYGLADVAEDLLLARLFSRQNDVSRLEGLLACVFTQAKLLTISLSLVGALLFLGLGRIFPNTRTG